MNSCDTFIENIVSYFEGDLAKDKTADFEKHKTDCSSCSKSFHDFEKLVKKFQGEEFAVPPQLLQQILTEILKTQK